VQLVAKRGCLAEAGWTFVDCMEVLGSSWDSAEVKVQLSPTVVPTEGQTPFWHNNCCPYRHHSCSC
jgi:hypothetical protein